MSYMAKKTQKRQTTIISLSDSNQQELENIKQQREQMITEYQDKKQGKWECLLKGHCHGNFAIIILVKTAQIFDKESVF